MDTSRERVARMRAAVREMHAAIFAAQMIVIMPRHVSVADRLDAISARYGVDWRGKTFAEWATELAALGAGQ